MVGSGVVLLENRQVMHRYCCVPSHLSSSAFTTEQLRWKCLWRACICSPSFILCFPISHFYARLCRTINEKAKCLIGFVEMFKILCWTLSLSQSDFNYIIMWKCGTRKYTQSNVTLKHSFPWLSDVVKNITSHKKAELEGKMWQMTNQIVYFLSWQW